MNIYLFYAIFSAITVFMIDYGLGHPADEEIGYGSFLFWYSFRFAKRRLKKGGLLVRLKQQYRDQLNKVTSPVDQQDIKRTYQELVFTNGRKLFTWEKAFGMCPYCFHFWFTVISFLFLNIFCLDWNIINFVFYLSLSHTLIRFLKRWI